MPQDPDHDVVSATEAEQDQLRRSLSNRHIQLIAIGGAIGTGLFMGSGRSIHVAGPSIMVVYAVVGFIIGGFSSWPLFVGGKSLLAFFSTFRYRDTRSLCP